MSRAKIATIVGIVVVPLVVVGALAWLRMQDRKANAIATCQKIERFHSNLGMVNVPLYALGKVLLLDTTANRAQGLMQLPVVAEDVAAGSAAEDLTVKLETAFTVKFDAEVPDTVRGEAESTLKTSTRAEMTKVARSDLMNPVAKANSSDELKTQLKAWAGDEKRRVVMVSSLKKADSLDLQLVDDAAGKAGANVLKAGGYQISVTFRCDGLVKMTGKQADTGVFFAVTPLTFDVPTDAIVLDSRPLDLWDFDLGPTFIGRP